MLVTDAQVHIWDVDRPDRPWPKDRFAPQLDNGWSAQQAVASMDAVGVDRAVIVPPTWIGENNLTALEACEAYPGRFAIMGRFDATQPPDAIRRELSTWKQQPNMLGIRVTTVISPFKEWLEGNEDSADSFWAEAERNEIPLMLLVNGQPRPVDRVAGKFSGLKIIIDHMGCNLRGNGPAECFEKIGDLLALARHPNVHVKVSSAPCFSVEEYPYNDVKPYLRRIYDAFGPRRLMWGADLTRLRGTYANCLRQFQEDLDFLSADDKEWILGRSIAEALNWPEPSR
jgi:predicted TIM-barrel fold metal-dependent hydrolase